MSCHHLIIAIVFATVLQAEEPGAPAGIPIGWASMEGGTTGGAEGPRVTVTDAAGFIQHAESTGRVVVVVTGNITLTRKVRIHPDKTITGLGAGSAIHGGGLQISGGNNIIIRNLSISDAEDAISIEKGAHHIWIDHCRFARCSDGLIDIKHGSDLITVSWNVFQDHHKACLLGHSDQESARQSDSGRLRVTYHHNYFNGSKTRHPRVRFANGVHLFNNYYRNNEYGVAAVMDAGVLVEGNVFEDVPQPTLTTYGDSPDPGRLMERNNLYIRSGKPQTRGVVDESLITYPYVVADPATIAETVSRGAGPREP